MKFGHINDWVPETKSLCERLIAAGCTLTSGDNGEEKFRFEEGKLDAFVENLIACDEARLFLRTRGGRHAWIYLVLGNEPGVIAADYICDDVLDSVIDAHYEEWSGKAQPTKPDPYQPKGGRDY